MASNPVPYAVLALARARHEELREPSRPRTRPVRPRHRGTRRAVDVVVPAQILRGTPAPTT